MRLLPSLLFVPAFLALACSEKAERDSDSNTVTPDAARDYEVTLSSDKLPVLQGTTASIELTVTRRNGFTGPVTITPTGLPNGASTPPLTIAGDKATLDITAAATAPHSLPTAVAVDDKKLTVTIHGTPGSLDTSFGAGNALPGAVILPVGDGDDYGYAMAVQPDGKIVMAGRAAEHLGDFAVVRLERDGTLDTAFGTGGKVMTDFAGGADTAYAVAVQADGRIVVAGSALNGASGTDFALARYEANGQLDSTFGQGGKTTTAFSNDADTAYSLLLLSDGSIVVGGDANNGASATGLDFALARYASNGQLTWKTTTPISTGSGRDTIYAVARHDVDGKSFIVAAGGEGAFSVARYDLDGKLDPTFGNEGRIDPPFNAPIGTARGVAVDANGNVVVTGHRDHQFATIRLDRGGRLDASFGEKGVVFTNVSEGNWNEAQAVAIEADGKIVLGGWTYEGGSSSANFALVRYDATGRLDPVFGNTGIVVSEIATKGKPDTANAIVLQSDERVPTTRVLVSGFASTSNSELAVARYWR